MKATSYWVLPGAPGYLHEQTLAANVEGHVLVRAHFSGISPGTEALIHRGLVPTSEYSRMRAPFQEGDFPGPVKYGYASAGEIIAGPSERLGERVFCLFPHQDYYWVPESAAQRLPPGVSTRRAVLAANMETALNALWDARPVPGDRVTVIGGGTVGGLLVSLLGRSLGLDVEVVDCDPSRQTWLESWGVRFSAPDQANAERDIVFNTSASAGGLRQALTLAKAAGRVVELSWFGSEQVALPLGEAFHVKRLQLISSQVGTISPNKPGWTYARRMDLALRLLNDDRLGALVEDAIPFAGLPAHFAALLQGPASSGARRCVQYTHSGSA